MDKIVLELVLTLLGLVFGAGCILHKAIMSRADSEKEMFFFMAISILTTGIANIILKIFL